MCKKLAVMVCFIKSPHHQRHTTMTTNPKRKSAIVELKDLLEDDGVGFGSCSRSSWSRK